MKRQILLFLAIVTLLPVSAKDIKVTLRNPLSVPREAVPVSMKVDADVRSALVTLNGVEVPCQLDDFDDDGIYDELSFVTDMAKKETQVFTVSLLTEGTPREYKARTYGSLQIRDRSAKNPKHIPMRSLTVPGTTNPYQYVFPHGPLLESEYVGFRIYCDHRQSVDYYGHRNKQLELEETQFYPTKEQKTTTYGDDVLYTGSTYGCGTLHGWDGKTAVMFDNARSRTYTLLATGPVRTIVETINRGWKVTPDAKPVDVTTRYMLYAGHRDVLVDVKFSRPVADIQLSTGVVDIVGSEELTDKAGIRGCWGTACAGNNPAVYDTHTVGLAVCVPKEYYKGDSSFASTPRELVGTLDEKGKPIMPNQAYTAIVGTTSDNLHYWFTATCDMETFGFADSKAWFDYLKQWKKQLNSPVQITMHN